ncbi:MAG TPA: hypothetical protein VJV78_29525, partial [Polyangiales bacterium]|nr:hypothetical protein [Polyangiales bacterium]
SSGAAGGAGGTPGKITFKVKNVPADADLTATDDLLLNTNNCGYPPEIDTGKLTINGCSEDKLKGKYTLSEITQADTSLGTLNAALLVTRRFVVEQGMNVNVVGNRPLIVVALDEALINGHLQASAFGQTPRGGGFGPGENGQNGLGPGGGGKWGGDSAGGGAGFCGKGGPGGTNGTNGGKTYGNPENVPLIGGSSGAKHEWYGSAGGGAIQISAGVRVEVGLLGVIHVGGGGCGWTAGGAGSGGAILLEAPKVRVVGHLAANGGGGSSPSSADASNGADASDDDQPALGGHVDMIPHGGNGSAGAMIDGQPGESGAMPGYLSGGGGGGAGRIRINVAEGEPEVTGLVSPSKGTACFTVGKL